MFDERAFIEEFQQAQTPGRLAELLRDPSPDQERALRLYLGDDRYQRLHGLAVRLETSRGVRGAQPGAGMEEGKPARPRNVIVIPGIMGSELTVYEARTSTLIWVSYWRLFRGWLDRLRLDEGGRLPYPPGAGYDVRASNILTKYYAELILRLGQTSNVRPFWYDWRKGLDVAAAELEAFVKAQFGDEPYSIVAHSMGGLVARTMLRLRQRPGGSDYLRGLDRLVMLGTPNHGSFEVPLIFAGLQDTVRDLVRLTGGLGGLWDSGPALHRLEEVLDSFPAIYQMLPWPDKLPDQPELSRLYQAQTYDAFNRSVSQAHLKAALEHHAWLSSMVDKDHMVYVAGFDQPTVTSIQDSDRLTDEAAYGLSRDGDGRVPHALGLLDAVPTFFVRGEHGKLPEHPQVLAAINDLLSGDLDQVNLPRAADLPRGMRGQPGQAAAPEPEAHRAWSLRREREKSQLDELIRRVEHRDARFVSRGAATSAGAADGPARPPSPLLSPDERRLEELLTRSFLGGGAPGEASAGAPVPEIRLQLKKAAVQDYKGSPDDKIPVDALAAGHYLGVRPSTSLLELDRALSMALGARDHKEEGLEPAEREARQERYLLTQYVERGILRGDLGVPFLVPDIRPRTSNDPVAPKDSVVAIAGMGMVGHFGAPELTVLARELCWSLGRLGKQHLATLVIGAGQDNLAVSEAVPAFLEGVAQALNSAAGRGLECITFVEADPRRMELVDDAINEARTDLQRRRLLRITYEPLKEEAREAHRDEGFEWEKAEWKRAYEERQRRRAARAGGDDRLADRAPTRIAVSLSQKVYAFAAMTQTAAVPERRAVVDPELVRQTNDALVATDDPEEQERLGRVLSRLLVPRDLRAQLFTDAPLVLMVDAKTARIHWEMVVQEGPDAPGPGPTGASPRRQEPGLPGLGTAGVAPGGELARDLFLGIARGFTRQLRTQFSLPPEPPPPPLRTLRVLVVADPAADARLPGAALEGTEVADLFEAFNEHYRTVQSRVAVTRLFGPHAASRMAVLSEIIVGYYDVLHFAGHCFFDADDPSASGWLFGRREVLSANELRRIDRVPKFVLSNACESGITPDRPEGRSELMAPSFAEGFFERGVANFVCTAWPVDDAAARVFARHLYGALLGLRVEDGPALKVIGLRDPEPMYRAVREARLKVAAFSSGARTWGAYQHYGNPYFRLFDREYLQTQRTTAAGAPGEAPAVAEGTTRPAG
jgi:hypothetical protein